MDYEKRLRYLELENKALREVNARLRNENAMLKQKQSKFEEENKSISEKLSMVLSALSKANYVKDSHNLHNPPSQDKGKVTRSLRKKGNKPTGGQTGHKGSTLEMREVCEHVIDLKPSHCQDCGHSLKGSEFAQVGRRQVFDIPVVKMEASEYRQYSCVCKGCGKGVKAEWPLGVSAPVQYGDNLRSMAVYMSCYQMVPYKRLADFFSVLTNHRISQGTLDNILQQTALRGLPVYELIKAKLGQAKVVGSDETSVRVGGKNHWVWVWQNAYHTFINIQPGRGHQSIVDTFGKDGLSNVVLVSDRWPAQLKVSSKGKQLCTAHLLRDLIGLQEMEKSDWAKRCQKAFKDALGLHRQAVATKQANRQTDLPALEIENRLDRLLMENIDHKDYPKSTKLQRSLLLNRPHLLNFLYDLDIPPDNNGSERAIRNIKVKMKVSGQFKSGHPAFAVLRSIIDTAIKQKTGVFQAIHDVLQLPIPKLILATT